MLCMLIPERNPHLFSTNPMQGVLQVKNLVTHKVLLVPSSNMKDDIQAIRFKLDLGTFEHRVLQQEYETMGLEIFSIEPYREVTADENLDAVFTLCVQECLTNQTPLY